MLKTAVAIRHVHYEDLGYFEEVLAAAGYKVHLYDPGLVKSALNGSFC